MEGVDTGGSRVPKSRRTSELSVERVELGHVLVGAALHQVDRWVEQWDRLQGASNSRHLRVLTSARSSGERCRPQQEAVERAGSVGKTTVAG